MVSEKSDFLVCKDKFSILAEKKKQFSSKDIYTTQSFGITFAFRQKSYLNSCKMSNMQREGLEELLPSMAGVRVKKCQPSLSKPCTKEELAFSATTHGPNLQYLNRFNLHSTLCFQHQFQTQIFRREQQSRQREERQAQVWSQNVVRQHRKERLGDGLFILFSERNKNHP